MLTRRVPASLAAQDAPPDLILDRAIRIVTDWGPEEVTLTSLEKHWSRFDGLAGQITEADVRNAKRQQLRRELRAALENSDE